MKSTLALEATEKFIGRLLLVTAFVASLAWLSACAPANPSLQAPDEKAGSAVGFGEAVKAPVVASPKVDILFVIDNSLSMEKHQEDLKANINMFVNEFEKNKSVDWQIGVVSVWDNTRFTPDFQAKFKIYEKGRLRPVAGANPSQPQFVTRKTQNYVQVLGETLKIGVLDYKVGGPEIEDIFSAVDASVSPANPFNQGFIRQDAHLAVIIITDADDVSPYTPKGMYGNLLSLKKGDAELISAYAVVAQGNCTPRDPGLVGKKGELLDPKNIMEFVKKANGQIYDICGDFGSHLAKAGNLIQEKAAHHLRVTLPRLPEKGTLKVRSGGQELPAGTVWVYDRRANAIVLKTPPANGTAQLDVEFVPFDFRQYYRQQNRERHHKHTP